MEQQQRAENQAEIVKPHPEMLSAAASTGAYKSHDEVNSEEDSIRRPMKETALGLAI